MPCRLPAECVRAEGILGILRGQVIRRRTKSPSDATFVTARGKLEGDAVRTFWTDAVKAGQGRSQEVTTVKFGASGDMAYLLGRYTGGITSPSGHTLQVWQRQADGTVSIVAQVSVPDPSAKQ